MSTNKPELSVAALLPDAIALDPAQLRFGKEAAGLGAAAGFVQTKLLEAVRAALDADVMAVLAEAWAKTAELRNAAQAQGAGQPTHLYLAKHEIACDNQLKLVLEFAGLPALTDHLDLRLKAQFEGVGLSIEQGCIVALDAGRGMAKLELLYSNAKLLSQSSDWVRLPASCTLAHPVRIV